MSICAGLLPTFDGTRLDATLTLPAGRAPRGGRPLVVFLHGLLADKSEYLSATAEGIGPDRGTNAYKTVHWNNRWFAARGFAVLNYSARGHGASGGSIELASRDVEVRDARQLIGMLADAGWAHVNPARIGVIGSSYGGGQAWLLMTTRASPDLPYGQWRSPHGRRVRLAALVPGYTWVAKQTLIDGFIASANTKLPPYVYRWLARTNEGEPHDLRHDATLAEAKRELTVTRSAPTSRTATSPLWPPTPRGAEHPGAITGTCPRGVSRSCRCSPPRAGRTRSSRRSRCSIELAPSAFTLRLESLSGHDWWVWTSFPQDNTSED